MIDYFDAYSRNLVPALRSHAKESIALDFFIGPRLFLFHFKAHKFLKLTNEIAKDPLKH